MSSIKIWMEWQIWWMNRFQFPVQFSNFAFQPSTLIRTAACLFSFLFLFLQMHAQQARQYSFRQYTVSNGLSSNTVSSVIQDKDGYIWLATINGLQRYDGNSFISFKAKAGEPFSIPSNHITSFYLDKKKNLWIIGINNKIGIFDTRKFRFNEAKLPRDVSKIYLPQQLMELPSGELILLKPDYGVFIYNEAKNEFIKSTSLFPMPAKWKITGIAWDRGLNKYWITSDSGLVQFDPKLKQLNYRTNNPAGDPVIAAFGNEKSLKDPFVDIKGNVIFHFWVSGQGSPTLCRYNRASNVPERISLAGRLKYHEIFGIFQQRNGRLWIYGLPFFAEWKEGLNSFNFISETFDDSNIDFDYPFKAMEDREGNVWIASDNGLFMFNPDAQIFSSYNLIRADGKPHQESPVQAAAELEDGRIFIGCWGNGLYAFDQKFHPIPLPSSIGKKGEGYSIWDMAVHPKTKQLWITMQGGRIAVYDAKKNTTIDLMPEIFNGSTIRQVDEDTSGNLWFGTQSGKIIKWDYIKSGNDPSKGYELVTQVGMVLKIHYDYQGYVWASSLGHGIVKLDARTNKIIRVFTSDGPPGERLFMDSPSDMTYYNDSTLIVAAGCLNIINTKTNKISFISTEEGLPSNTAESIERDETNILWIGMTNGICRLNLEKKLISYYDRRDGIAYDKFAASGVKELDDGRIILFTDHNFLVFDPNRFGQQNMPPKAFLTSFRIADKTYSIDSLLKRGSVVLNYNNTSIGINFSSLSYLQQRKLHYYYMLEGADREWIRTDYPYEAIYNFLAPGRYTFKVKTENPDGISSNEITSIKIIVRPPFWNTWWFYGLMILLIITVLYLIDRERLNKRRSIQQMRRDIASNLHLEVNETLNNINVLSEIAKIKADKNVEQSKAFIDQISTKSKYMIEAMDDMLWSIDPKNDSMKKMLLRFKEFTENMKAVNAVDIDLIVDHKVQSLELDMKLRHEILALYKDVLTFIIKNSDCAQVFVNINLVKSKLLLEILSECKGANEEFKNRFHKLLKRKHPELPASVDVIADSQSFSVILLVNLRQK